MSNAENDPATANVFEKSAWVQLTHQDRRNMEEIEASGAVKRDSVCDRIEDTADICRAFTATDWKHMHEFEDDKGVISLASANPALSLGRQQVSRDIRNMEEIEASGAVKPDCQENTEEIEDLADDSFTAADSKNMAEFDDGTKSKKYPLMQLLSLEDAHNMEEIEASGAVLPDNDVDDVDGIEDTADIAFTAADHRADWKKMSEFDDGTFDLGDTNALIKPTLTRLVSRDKHNMEEIEASGVVTSYDDDADGIVDLADTAFTAADSKNMSEFNAETFEPVGATGISKPTLRQLDISSMPFSPSVTTASPASTASSILSRLDDVAFAAVNFKSMPKLRVPKRASVFLEERQSRRFCSF